MPSNILQVTVAAESKQLLGMANPDPEDHTAVRYKPHVFTENYDPLDEERPLCQIDAETDQHSGLLQPVFQTFTPDDYDQLAKDHNHNETYLVVSIAHEPDSTLLEEEPVKSKPSRCKAVPSDDSETDTSSSDGSARIVVAHSRPKSKSATISVSGSLNGELDTSRAKSKSTASSGSSNGGYSGDLSDTESEASGVDRHRKPGGELQH